MLIPLVQCLFDDNIISNEFATTEYPHTMTGLQSSITNKFYQFWKDNMCKQFQSIYKDYQNIQGIPPRLEVENITRYNHCNWDPVDTLFWYNGQSPDSFQEQIFAISVLRSTIDKYINPSMTHSKVVVIN